MNEFDKALYATFQNHAFVGKWTQGEKGLIGTVINLSEKVTAFSNTWTFTKHEDWFTARWESWSDYLIEANSIRELVQKIKDCENIEKPTLPQP